MMKLNDILARIGAVDAKSLTHSEPLEYRCASFPSEKLSPQSNTIYLCNLGQVPKNYSDFPSCCILLISDDAHHIQDVDSFQCEWCILKTGISANEVISEIQFVLSNSSKNARIHILKNKLTIGRLTLALAAREACEIMGNPIAVFDESYRVLAMESLGQPVENEVWRAAKTNGFFTAENVRAFREAIGENDISYTPFLCTTHAWEKTHCLVMQLITESGALVGSVALYECFRPFEADDCDTMIQLAQLLSALLVSSKPEDTIHRKRDALLQELIDGTLLESAELDKRIAECKWESWSIYRLGYINLSDDPTLKRQCRYFCKIISSAVPDAVILLRNRNLVILFCAAEYNKISEMLGENEAVLNGQSLSMGLSGCFFTLNDIRAAYDSARDALSLGREFAGKHPIYYSQQTFFFSILNTLSPQYIHKLYLGNCYTRIDEYDKRYQTNYCSTLVRYIENMFRSTQTASELFIHKNSLLYRIGRVKSLFGVDLNSFLDIFEFWLGYQISIFLSCQESDKSAAETQISE